MDKTEFKEEIKVKAKELGFDLLGVCKPEYSPADHDHLLRWLEKGYHGDMHYMARNPRQRSDPRLFLEGVRSIVTVGMNYYKEPGYNADTPYISIYARGRQYQNVLKSKLKTLMEFIKQKYPEVNGKIAVDTSPTFDKLWALKAGLGWRGKNTLIINKKIGSFIFLGEIFLDIELNPDIPQPDHCADCQICLDACPTGALEQPYVLNAAKCISYLTIEAKSARQNPKLIGNHIFGCDLCQLACPYNESAPFTQIPEFAPAEGFSIDFAHNWRSLTEIEYKNRYMGTILHDYGFNRYKKNLEMVEKNLKCD